NLAKVGERRRVATGIGATAVLAARASQYLVIVGPSFTEQLRQGHPYLARLGTWLGSSRHRRRQKWIRSWRESACSPQLPAGSRKPIAIPVDLKPRHRGSDTAHMRRTARGFWL